MESWLQQSQKRPTTKSVMCTLWTVHTVQVQFSRTAKLLTTSVLIAEAVTHLSSITSISCLTRWSRFAASASDRLCNPDKHFLYSLPYFLIVFPPQLVHHNKSSVHMNNDNDNPDCHLLKCTAELQQGEN